MQNGKITRGKRADTYNRALHVLARMRRTGDTLTAASREEHIDSRTVRKYVGAELRGLAEGRTQPTKADRRKRNMLIPTSLCPAPIVVRVSKQASQLGRYMAAVGKYLKTGDTPALEEVHAGSHVQQQFLVDVGAPGRARRHPQGSKAQPGQRIQHEMHSHVHARVHDNDRSLRRASGKVVVDRARSRAILRLKGDDFLMHLGLLLSEESVRHQEKRKECQPS